MVASQSIFKAMSLKNKTITYEPYPIQTVHDLLLVSYAKAVGPFLFASRLIYSRPAPCSHVFQEGGAIQG